MEIKLVTLLVCISIVAGEIYYIPTVIIDTPVVNGICPPEIEAVRNVISQNISDIIDERFNNFSIPECGGSGWRRVAYLNMTDPDQTCPDAWRPYEQDPTIRACGRQSSNIASCNSVIYNTDEYEYTQVCGRINGYQFASPDGVYLSQHTRTIDSAYVDGISITHGTPRHHIWTFYGGVREFSFGCCRASTSFWSIASFVENNYFCDTGNPTNAAWQNMLFTDDPLWDGVAGCTSNTSCCAPQSGPWFHTVLDHDTMDPIEIRICGGESTSNEDTPVYLVDIYVK